MNRMKFYLLIGFLGLAYGCFAQPQAEIDSLCNNETALKTFKVRKVDTETEPPLLPKSDLAISSEIHYVAVKKTEPEEAIQMPSLAYDEKGLMKLLHLAPFSDHGKAPDHSKYVIFSFEVNEHGMVSDIRIFDTNDWGIVDILIIKLSKTVWNPALTKSGNSTPYNFGRWIAAVPKNVNDRDYEEHRY